MPHATDSMVIATPIGRVMITCAGDRLTSLAIGGGEPAGPAARHRLLDEAAAQLDAYFAGRLTRFDLPLEPLSTARGNALRAGIAAIGYGEMLSYGALARMLGSAPRAIGQACARNPLPIIVPCHRVTSSGGAPERYSGGDGPATKAWLNAHEARRAAAG